MTTQEINNGKINEAFLYTLHGNVYQEIVGSMARHYGISIDEATDELIDDDAENILEYLQGTYRTACRVLFQKWKMAKIN